MKLAIGWTILAVVSLAGTVAQVCVRVRLPRRLSLFLLVSVASYVASFFTGLILGEFGIHPLGGGS